MLKIPAQVHKNKHIDLALSFDGTKVLTSLLLSTRYNAIARGVCPNHFISVTEMDEEMIESKLHPSSDIQYAKEIKVAVVSIQDVGQGINPFFTLSAQPESINIVSLFNKRVTNFITALCR